LTVAITATASRRDQEAVVGQAKLAPGDRHDACGYQVDEAGCCGCTDWGTGMMPVPIQPQVLTELQLGQSDCLVPAIILSQRSRWQPATNFPQPGLN